jgi:hypothetical protein
MNLGRKRPRGCVESMSGCHCCRLNYSYVALEYIVPGTTVQYDELVSDSQSECIYHKKKSTYKAHNWERSENTNTVCVYRQKLSNRHKTQVFVFVSVLCCF